MIEERIFGYGQAGLSPTRSYLYASYVDEPIAVIIHSEANPIHYYHHDSRYSVQAISDQSGAVIERYSYSAYGEWSVTDALGNPVAAKDAKQPYGYTGRRYDSETDLYYFRARYFDSEMGRFISRDPLHYVDGYSMYRGYFVPGLNDFSGLFVNQDGTVDLNCGKINVVTTPVTGGASIFHGSATQFDYNYVHTNNDPPKCCCKEGSIQYNTTCQAFNMGGDGTWQADPNVTIGLRRLNDGKSIRPSINLGRGDAIPYISCQICISCVDVRDGTTKLDLGALDFSLTIDNFDLRSHLFATVDVPIWSIVYIGKKESCDGPRAGPPAPQAGPPRPPGPCDDKQCPAGQVLWPDTCECVSPKERSRRVREKNGGPITNIDPDAPPRR